MRACIIFNPTARGNRAQRQIQSLGLLAGQAVLKPTTGPGVATTLAQVAVDEGFDVIVAAGGDGTVNEVVNGVARVPGGWVRCQLGVIPLGTINVFARELGLPTNLTAAWRVIQAGDEVRIDLPWVEPRGRGINDRRWWVQLAGAGLDSRAIARVNWQLKTRVGPAAYVWAGLKAFQGRQPRLRVRTPERVVDGELVLLGNGRLYGGLPMFPEANLRDGLIEVRIVPRVSWGALMKFGWQWVTRRCHIPGDHICLRTSTLELEADQPVPYELDGDNAGQLPARFGVEPGVLRVIVPG